MDQEKDTQEKGDILLLVQPAAPKALDGNNKEALCTLFWMVLIGYNKIGLFLVMDYA